MFRRKVFAVVLLAMVIGTFASPARASADDAALLSKQDLQLALRELWTGHVFWVRSVVVATHYDDTAAADAAEKKAVENARALADAIVPLYGQEAADALFELLAGHYGGIKAYMEATFADNAGGQKKAAGEINANAEAIADFLDGANPNLPKNVVLPLLAAHGGHHIQQIKSIHEGDFANEAIVWDAMLTHIHAIGDAMAAAFAAQFPDKIAG
ncbi:MAG TPA: hypothetical protein VF190_09840 [Rhodothermales bacterium]